MYRFIAYLRHLITATNQHGVHSPFVYNFVTQCLYTRPKFKGAKIDNVVLKAIPYFSIEKFKISSKDDNLKQSIQNQFGLKVLHESPYDMLYFDNPVEKVLSTYADKIHNDSMIFFGNIHKNSANTSLWYILRSHKTVTVSIDMFYIGVLFFRKEQVKEDFKIRI